jgi:hypothetical protein
MMQRRLAPNPTVLRVWQRIPGCYFCRSGDDFSTDRYARAGAVSTKFGATAEQSVQIG